MGEQFEIKPINVEVLDLNIEVCKEFVNYSNAILDGKEKNNFFKADKKSTEAFDKCVSENDFEKVKKFLSENKKVKKNVVLYNEFYYSKKTAKEFKRIVNEEFAIIDFWGSGCFPCETQSEILEEDSEKIVSKFPTIKVYKMDTGSDGGISDNLGIDYIPTIAVIYKKNIGKMKSGPKTAEQIIEKIESFQSAIDKQQQTTKTD